MEIKVQKHLLDSSEDAGANLRQSAHKRGDVGKTEPVAERPIQLLCPIPTMVTTADPLKVSVITTLAELVGAVSTDVLAIDDPRLLSMLLEYADVFNVQPIVVLGVPSAVYTADFEQATWELDRVSYDTLIADLKASEMVSQIKEREAGVRPPQSRKPGRDPAKMPASRFTDFDMAKAEEADDAIPSEEGR